MPEDTTAALRGCGHDDSIEIDDRTRRALTEPMSAVSVEGAPLKGDETVVSVESHSGESYDIDVREGRCSCPDMRHRQPEGGCKHVRRARVALGRETVDARTLRAVDVDDTLGASAPGPRVATSDGGVIGAEASTEIVDAGAPATWKGPFTEYGRYGEPTGAQYVRCSECGVEVLEGEMDYATHRDGCDGVGGAGR